MNTKKLFYVLTFLLPAVVGIANSHAANGFPDSLRRRPGQTVFHTISPENYAIAMRGGGLESAMTMAASAESGQPRAQQESDVFKFVDDGLLYLLNNARGLQAIGVDDNAFTLSLLSRVNIPGEEMREMYLDKKSKRMLVLSTSGNTSRISVYDIADPKKVNKVQDIDLDGNIADSRLVGDVLYVASQNYAQQRGREKTPQGIVTSFDLSQAKITKIQAHTLVLPVAERENMGIVEEQDAQGNYHYYLTAVLSQNRWGGWWGTQSDIEVIDISDPQGAIRPVMVVSAKGFVAQRQQVFIQNNSLFVAGNYYTNASGKMTHGWDSIGRVSVEEFKFPAHSGDEIIDAEEKLYRELHLKREIQRLVAEAEKASGRTISESMRDALIAKLHRDPNGLQGRFLRETHTLRKVISDAIVTSGDTTGQSANLREVRYVDDLVLAFWVPTNEVDPLDIFQRTPKGLVYKGRLQFEGWIEKAFPKKIGDRLFIVGLGWQRQATDQRQERRAQIKLFEIIEKEAGVFVAKDLATQLLQEKHIYANLGDLDKNFTVQIDDAGKGHVLFQSTGVIDGEFRSGAKVITFDIAKADKGETVFTDHPLMSVKDVYLNRVFANPAGHVMNFADSQLALFSQKLDSIGNSGVTVQNFTLTLKDNDTEFAAFLAQHPQVQVLNTVAGIYELNIPADAALIKAVTEHPAIASFIPGETITQMGAVESKPTLLELSRNIVAYFPTTHGGIQAINPGIRYGYNTKTQTEFRLVDRADAERDQAYDRLEVEGRAVAFHQMADRVLVVTQINGDLKGGLPITRLSMLRAGTTRNSHDRTQGMLTLEYSIDLPQTENSNGERGVRIGWSYSNPLKLLALPQADTFLLSAGTQHWYVKLQDNTFVTTEIQPPAPDVQFLVLDDKVWAYWEEFDLAASNSIYSPAEGHYRHLRLAKSFFAEVLDPSVAVWTYGKAINIPGKPLSKRRHLLLVSDAEVMDIEINQYGAPEMLTRNLLTVVELAGSVAILTDSRERKEVYTEGLNIGGSLVALREQDNGYGPSFISGYEAPRNYYLERIRISEDAFIEENRERIRDITLKGHLQMLEIIADPSEAGRYFAILSNGRQVQLVTWTREKPLPQRIDLLPIKEDGTPANTPTDLMTVPYGFSYYAYSWEGREGKITFNPQTRRLHFAAGNAGVCEAQVLSTTARPKED